MALKFGIIGHGFMGHEHEKMLMNFDGIEVVAECDIDPDQLKDVPEGVKSYEKAEDLINDPDVEVVLVVANNNQHKKLVIQAAEAGKDVICEKPVAMSIEDLDEMKEACDKAGVKFTVHHQRRFDPDFRTAKEVYDSGTLGKLYTIQSSLYGYNGNMHDWHVIPEEGGGMLVIDGTPLICGSSCTALITPVSGSVSLCPDRSAEDRYYPLPAQDITVNSSSLAQAKGTLPETSEFSVSIDEGGTLSLSGKL